MAVSSGQALGLVQLHEIVTRSKGALEIVAVGELAEDSTYLAITLSLATRSYRRPDGLALRDRERLELRLYPDFPFKVPALHFGHTRFLGTAHVQWGSSICLYQSVETEWNPADGLFGFFERVERWMAAAGAGTLDPDDAPLHPPSAYAQSKTRIVVKADAPAVPAGDVWLGRADIKRVRDDRLDVLGWRSLDDWGDAAPPDGRAVGAVLFDTPLPMEFPTKIKDLRVVLERAGLAFGMLYSVLRLIAISSPDGKPAYLMLGAPMRRKAPGEPLRQHLTGWEISVEAVTGLRALVQGAGDQDAALDAVVHWMVTADVAWCTMMEDRPEIVIRRDLGAVAGELAGKRVLLLSCGALGSPIAENVVRAGATAIELVDNGYVRPGILVRQRYCDADIGRAKAWALRDRLMALGLPCTISAQGHNLALAALTHFGLADWDIIIDATASVQVGHRLECELVDTALSVPLITLSVSAAAQHGAVAVRMPGYRGGPHQIARQAKLAAFVRDREHPLVAAFWPARDMVKIFQPEPGCSAPTFIGSALDLDHHAAGLLNLGLSRVRSLAAWEASFDMVAASWLPRAAKPGAQLGYTFESYASHREQEHDYLVLQSDDAARGIAAEISRIARTRSNKVETGGLMFGEIDDAHRHIWIDGVSGPPPDSVASPSQFLCGTQGTADLAAFKERLSGGSCKFVGIWHTHPVSRGRPSDDDMTAMVDLLLLQPFPPRQVVMLIIGHAATRPVFNYYLFRRDQFRLISLAGAAEAL